jgi:hypothetical protein
MSIEATRSATMNKRLVRDECRVVWWSIMGCNPSESIAFAKKQGAELGLADACGIFQHGLEDWL